MATDLGQLIDAEDWGGLQHALQATTYPAEALSTALVKTMFLERIDAVRALLNAGADPDLVPDAVAMPALCAAAESQWTEGVQLLIAHGADVNIRAQHVGGWTPLMFAVDAAADAACQGGPAVSLDLVDVLLDHGADPAVRDDRNETATEIARSYAWQDAVALLDAHTP